jgi:drug/metabolite transporter (DMT)-like permease
MFIVYSIKRKYMNISVGKIYLTVAFILAGSSVVVARYVSGNLQPFTITFMSLAFASITALLFRGKSIFSTVLKLSKRHWIILFLQALFGIFLFRVFLTFGLKYTSAIEAGIVIGTTSAITAVFARFILKDHFNKNSLLGILFTSIGVLVLQGFPFKMDTFDKSHLLGNLLVIGAASSEALFTTLSRKAHIDTKEDYKLNPFVQSGIVSIIALILCTIPMLFENPYSDLTVLPIDGWIALIWYGTIVTVIAFACMFTGAKHCDGYTIAAFTGLIPMSALILSIVILKEVVTINKIIGCCLIIISIIIMSRKTISR